MSAGPDAALANSGEHVCSSCHSLERVNNKKGDSDAWAATVNRIEQVPLLVAYLIKNAGTFTVAASGGAGKGKAGGKGGAKGKGGGFAAKNLRC